MIKKSKPKIKLNEQKIDWSNWNTTDSDEIVRRMVRADIGGFKLENLGNQPYFSTFCVYNSSNKQYHVEIRSLNEYINSCNCRDYKSNELGTCKHIEFVMKKLQKKGVRAYAKASANGSEQIEIYLSILNDFKVSVKWPNKLPNYASKIIEPFFSADGTLLGENVVESYEELVTIIQEHNTKISQEIRVSEHIAYFMHYEKINSQKEYARNIFLQDVKAGKRKLNTVRAQLLSYQIDGMLHLAFTERALLADEMGLGKTIQAIAACELLKQSRQIQRVLVVTTASLKSEWEEQIARFSDSSSLIIYGSRAIRLKQYKNQSFYYVMNYEQVVSDYSEIQKILAPDVIILDEAQRIKNWHTKTATKIKELDSRYAFVLTGTPVENRIDDIYSLIQFLDPHLFGPLFRFNRNFYSLDENGKPEGYKNLNQMYHKLRPVMLCRKKIDVEDELPERINKNFFVTMDAEQRIRYDENDAQVAKILGRAKKRTLTKAELDKLQRHLACMRMICDTPYILDEDCRISPKINELQLILEDIMDDPNSKIIIFSEWERMLLLANEMLEKQDIGVAWHTGSVDQKKRRENINRFKNDPKCQVFLSTDAGSVGLNLQVANVVINLDLPWNPAKLEQRIARAWRKNQLRTVQVINLICEQSIEHRMLYLLEQKRTIATAVLTDDPELSTIKMPSGRAAFIERMEQLININPNEHNSTDTKNVKAEKLPTNIQNMKNIILGETGLGLDLLTYQSIGDKSVVLSVSTNKNLPEIEEKVKERLQGNNVSLEMISSETYDIIKRLADAGILTLNVPDVVMHDKMNKACTAEMQQEQIIKANSHLEQAERKHRMANVLIQSDFFDEAIVPLRESVTQTINAFCHLVGETNLKVEDLTSDQIKKLADKYNFPDEITKSFFKVMSNKDLDVNEFYKEQEYLISSITNMRNEYRQAIH